jgi:uncharacterized protein
MNTKQKLEASLKDAMRSRDDVRKSTIRMALTTIKLAEVEKGAELDENSLLSIIQKEIKNRRESIQDAQKANRADLIKSSEDEIIILEEFLPQPLSDAELQEQVQAAINEVGAKSPTDMGKVMKILVPRIQGRAANDRISLMVRQLLQS